jgi:hypothetical protein
LLVTALSSIREATKAKLNREVEILGITYPDYIWDHGYIRILLDVAIQTLGYPTGTNIDTEDNLLLQFDYQNSLLEVSITAITTEATSVEGHFRIADFGGTTQVASVRTSLSYYQ